MQAINNLRLFPTKHSNVSKVVLFLPSGQRTIGLLERAAGGVFSTSRTRAHVHWFSNSLRENYNHIYNYSFRWIDIDYEGRRLVPARGLFPRNGKVLNFSKGGFELHIFLPLEQFGQDKTLEFETIPPRQSALFVGDTA